MIPAKSSLLPTTNNNQQTNALRTHVIDFRTKRREALERWDDPSIFEHCVEFNPHPNLGDEFDRELFSFNMKRIEEKLTFRMQDKMAKRVGEEEPFIVGEMSRVMFKLFRKHLRLFCVPKERKLQGSIRNLGVETLFTIYEIEYSEQETKTMPPLLTAEWSIPKWIDEETGEMKRAYASRLKFIYSSHTSLLSAELSYYTQKFDSKLSKWDMCE